jgi:hypothetical protein
MSGHRPETASPKASGRARPKTGVIAAAEEIMSKARAIAADSAKKTRPLLRKKEAIALEIESLETAIAAKTARIHRLRVKEIETQKEIEIAETGVIAVLKAMGGQQSDPASEDE